MFKIIIVILIGVVAISVFAQEPEALTFQGWKEQQVLDAQNQVLRVSARIAQLKSGKSANSGKESSAPLPNSKIKKAEVDTIPAAEKDLRRAQETLRGANELSLEVYVAVYLPTLRDSPEALQALAQKMTKEELGEIFKILLRKDPDTKRNASALTDGLSVSSRAKAP